MIVELFFIQDDLKEKCFDGNTADVCRKPGGGEEALNTSYMAVQKSTQKEEVMFTTSI